MTLLHWPLDQRPAAPRFLLEVGGVEVGLFAEAAGLDTAPQGTTRWCRLTLTRGHTVDDALRAWVVQPNGPAAALTVVDGFGKRLGAWEFRDAYPVRWSGPGVGGDAVPTQSLEVAHHGFAVRLPVERARRATASLAGAR